MCLRIGQAKDEALRGAIDETEIVEMIERVGTAMTEIAAIAKDDQDHGAQDGTHEEMIGIETVIEIEDGTEEEIGIESGKEIAREAEIVEKDEATDKLVASE